MSAIKSEEGSKNGQTLSTDRLKKLMAWWRGVSKIRKIAIFDDIISQFW